MTDTHIMLPLIVPAILTDNFDTFKEQLAKVSAHFSSVHIDVIDGIFLPHKTFSERAELKDINSEAYFELHLMVKDPLSEIANWEDVDNVTNVVFHIEAAANVVECLQAIKQHGWKAGIALNPETPLEKILPYVNMADEILFMTVHPGQQGAAFVPEVLEKIKEFKKIHPNMLCSVDGGVNKNTILTIQQAGADKLCIGSALTKSDDTDAAHQELINILTA